MILFIFRFNALKYSFKDSRILSFYRVDFPLFRPCMTYSYTENGNHFIGAFSIAAAIFVEQIMRILSNIHSPISYGFFILLTG